MNAIEGQIARAFDVYTAGQASRDEPAPGATCDAGSPGIAAPTDKVDRIGVLPVQASADGARVTAGQSDPVSGGYPLVTRGPSTLPPQEVSATTIRLDEDGAGEDLLSRSLRATLGMAEQFGEMREIKNRLARRIAELEGLQALVRELSKQRESTSILVGLADAALSIPGAKAASVLTRSAADARLEEDVVLGLTRDPMVGGTGPGSPAEDLLSKGEPVLLDSLPLVSGATPPDASGLTSAMVVPLSPALRQSSLVVVYGEAPFEPDDLRFLSLLSAHAGVCLDNAAMNERLTRYSEQLEREVQARTEALEKANEELRDLDRMKDRFLSSVSHEMKTPLTGISAGIELLSTIVPENH